MKLVCCVIALALAHTDDPSGATIDRTTRSASRSAETEVWPLKLEDAIRIALDNSEFARVIRFGEQSVPVGDCFHPPEKAKQPRERPAAAIARSIVIEQVNPDASPLRFKSETMALVRSVEQQYWSFAHASGVRSAADQTVKLAHKVVAAEQDELAQAHGSAVNLAEASDHLERLEQNLSERTLDVIAAERTFREILGLPGSDGRRIIPVTPPTEARLELDWETCLDTLMHEQPDIIHQTTHCLARAFLEVDATYKSYASAKRVRSTAEKRLEAQQLYWKEGRITPDRFLDSVEQYRAADEAEHRNLAAYNSAIAFLSECKGTLLADHNIVVAEPHNRDEGEKTAEKTQDQQARKASFTPTATQPGKPTFLDLWQVSTCPWLVPSFMINDSALR